MEDDGADMTYDRIRLYFGVFEGDPDRISEIMGVTPFRSWRKGDAGPSGSTRTHDRWELRGPGCERELFSAQLEELLGILEDKKSAVQAVASEYDAGVMCTATFSEEYNPELHMSSSAIARLAALGLSCDFDLYMLGGTD